MVVNCSHSADANAVGGALSPGSLIHVTGMDESNSWLRVDLGGEKYWLMREVITPRDRAMHLLYGLSSSEKVPQQDLILAVPHLPKLYKKPPSLPIGSSLRIRVNPSADAAVTRLTSNSYFYVVDVTPDQNWVHVRCFNF